MQLSHDMWLARRKEHFHELDADGSGELTFAEIQAGFFSGSKLTEANKSSALSCIYGLNMSSRKPADWQGLRQGNV